MTGFHQRLLSFVFISLFGSSSQLFAYFEVKIFAGPSIGSLQLDKTRPASTFMGYGAASMNTGFFLRDSAWLMSGTNGFGFSMGAIYAVGQYKQGGFTYQSRSNGIAIGPGFLHQSDTYDYSYFLLSMLNYSMVGKNISSGQVNDQDYGNSTLAEHHGSPGFVIRTIIRNKTRRKEMGIIDLMNIDLGFQVIKESKIKVVNPIRSFEYSKKSNSYFIYLSYLMSVNFPL